MKAVPYFQCAICHEPIRLKGPSLIILHDDEGKNSAPMVSAKAAVQNSITL